MRERGSVPNATEPVARLRRHLAVAIEARDWTAALEACDLLIRRDRTQWREAMRLARGLDAAGRRSAAHALWDALAVANPAEAEVLAGYGRHLLAAGDAAAALHWLGRALERRPADADLARDFAAARLRAAPCGAGARAELATELVAVEAEIAAGDEAKCGRAAELAARCGDEAAAEVWLGRFRGWADRRGPRQRHEAARQSGDFLWSCGRWAEALGFYLEAEAHLVPPAAARLAPPPPRDRAAAAAA
jgi:hypothetical protein